MNKKLTERTNTNSTELGIHPKIQHRNEFMFILQKKINIFFFENATLFTNKLKLIVGIYNI